MPRQRYYIGGRAVNKEIDSLLREVQEVLNLVDALARRTGHFLNSFGTEEEKNFENSSDWVFKEQRSSLAAIERVQRSIENAEKKDGSLEMSDKEDFFGKEISIDKPVPLYDLDELIRRDEDLRADPLSNIVQPSSTPHSEGMNLSPVLRSHHVSSQLDYKSPRSRWLEAQSEELKRIRERLAAISTSPKSACELVGPIAGPKPATPKKPSSGVTVTMGGGSYASISKSITKSKSMFGDFVSPNTPNYQCLWERSRNRHARQLSQHR